MADQNHFTPYDYITVIATLLFSLVIGIYYACKKQTTEDLLVGGRNLSALPIAASMLVTYLSAITILELRFESIWVRWTASFIFILQVTMISGIILYAPAIALKGICGIPVWLSLVGIGIIGTIYTSLGGLRAVVWTDVFQFFMIMIGMLAIVIKGFISAGGIYNAFQIASDGGRLEIFDFTVDIFQRHNVLNFVLGYGVAVIVLYGTHQPQVQRYCSLPDVKDAYKAIAFVIPMNIFVMILVVFTGISIYATYAGCDPILLGHIRTHDQIVPYFVVKELYKIPGIMGLFISCIFSAVLSSISSALNSLTAVTWEDFLKRIPFFKNMGPSGQSHTTRALAVFYGLLVIALGFIAQNLGAIFQATITAVGATTGALGGVFVLGLFLPCVNKYGALSGMLTSLILMMYLAVNAFLLMKKTPFNIPLPNSVDQCPEELLTPQILNKTLLMNSLSAPEIEWPEKLYTLSYMLYSFVGSLICVLVGLLVSAVTGGCSQSKNVDRKYLHPLLFPSKCVEQKRDQATIKSNSKNADRIAYNYHRVGENTSNGHHASTISKSKV